MHVVNTQLFFGPFKSRIFVDSGITSDQTIHLSIYCSSCIRLDENATSKTICDTVSEKQTGFYNNYCSDDGSGGDYNGVDDNGNFGDDK